MPKNLSPEAELLNDLSRPDDTPIIPPLPLKARKNETAEDAEQRQKTDLLNRIRATKAKSINDTALWAINISLQQSSVDFRPVRWGVSPSPIGTMVQILDNIPLLTEIKRAWDEIITRWRGSGITTPYVIQHDLRLSLNSRVNRIWDSIPLSELVQWTTPSASDFHERALRLEERVWRAALTNNRISASSFNTEQDICFSDSLNDIVIFYSENNSPFGGRLISQVILNLYDALPEQAPEFYAGFDHSGNPVDFLRNVWGKYIDAGLMQRADLRRLDKPLYDAFHSYCQRNDLDPSSILPSSRPSLSATPEERLERLMRQRREASARYRAKRVRNNPSPR